MDVELETHSVERIIPITTRYPECGKRVIDHVEFCPQLLDNCVLQRNGTSSSRRRPTRQMPRFMHQKGKRPVILKERRLGDLSLSHQPWARRWIIRYSPWCMASATSYQRLSSHQQSITAHWPVPIYTAWWQRHTYAWTTCLGLHRKAQRPEPIDIKASAVYRVPTTSPRHTHTAHRV